MTKAEMSAKLQSLGLKRRYKPVWVGDADAGNIALETRKFSITDGELHGCRIELVSDAALDVWTGQKTKAAALARAQGFPIRLYDGEAAISIPVARADEFLHGFGAKVKTTRVLTPEQLAATRERMAKVHAARKVSQATPQ